MRKLHELLLGKVPNNDHVRMFGSKPFVLRDKSKRKIKLDDHVKEPVYMGIWERPRRALVSRTAEEVTSKHATFDRSTYHLSGVHSEAVWLEEGVFDKSDYIIANINDETVNDQSVMRHVPKVRENEMHSDLVPNETRQTLLQGSSEADLITLEHSTVDKEIQVCEKVMKRYAQGERHVANRFTVEKLLQARDDDDPQVKDALNGGDAR